MEGTRKACFVVGFVLCHITHKLILISFVCNVLVLFTTAFKLAFKSTRLTKETSYLYTTTTMQVNLKNYVLGSTLLAVSVVSYIYHTRQQFYPTAVHLVDSKGCLMVSSPLHTMYLPCLGYWQHGTCYYYIIWKINNQNVLRILERTRNRGKFKLLLHRSLICCI